MRVILIAASLYLCAFTMNAQSVPRTIDIVSELVEKWTDVNIGVKSSDVKRDTVVLTVTTHPDADWVYELIAERLAATTSGVVVAGYHSGSVSEDVGHVVTIADLSTQYFLIEDTDSLRRVVTADIRLRTPRDRESISRSKVYTHETRCVRADALRAESRQHNATYGVIPPEPRSFWDDILEPAVFIAAAAVTVVLLFTVRTQ